ncbi:MAG: YdeI/OmpD-associated family protein [Pseudomonadota bacterium]
MSFYPFQFEGEIVEHDVGARTYVYSVVFLPKPLHKDLPLEQHPRLRLTGEINDHPFDAALTPVRGRWYILLSKKVLKAINAMIGDTVEVRFDIANQDAVDIPDRLQAALKTDKQMMKLWNEQTPGMQRGLAYRVASAKMEKTQAKRVNEVFSILKGERKFRG